MAATHTYTPLTTEAKQQVGSGSGDNGVHTSVEPITLSWQNISLTLPLDRAKAETSWGAIPVDPEAQSLLKANEPASKQVLDNVNGVCRPGTFTAILGSSGAGKTTLLNILSQRNKEYEGQVLLNGRVCSPAMLHHTAFVEQTDLFYNKLTVREHLEIQAKLRLPGTISEADRASRVDKVIKDLALRADTIIGANGAGISGGERRRLTFAAELLTDPSLLFLDEPTSGLDSTMAADVLTQLHRLARGGRTIVCTVHQPDPHVFALFDNVLIMAEGRVAYFGAREDLVPYMARDLRSPLPEDEDNPAAHMIKLISVTATRTLGEVQTLVLEVFENSEQKKKMMAIQAESTESFKGQPVAAGDADEVVHRSSWMTQFTTLCRRAWINILRDPGYLSARLSQQIVVNVILGLVALRLTDSQTDLHNKTGALFFIMWNTTFSSVWSVSVMFPPEMPLFIREYKAGLYRADTFFLARNLVELPAQIMFPMIYGTISYWMVGFNDNFEAYLKYIFSLTFSAQAAASLGYVISGIGGNVRSVADITPLILFPFLICGGLILSVSSIPRALQWMVDISLFHDAYELMCIAVFKDYTIECATGEECNYTSGTQVLSSLSFSASNLTKDLFRMLAYLVIFRLAGFALIVWRGRAKGMRL